MDQDRIDGAAKQVKGTIKEAIGKVTGDIKTQAEGAAEKTLGKAQSRAGEAKDAARDALGVIDRFKRAREEGHDPFSIDRN